MWVKLANPENLYHIWNDSHAINMTDAVQEVMTVKIFTFSFFSR